MPSWQATTSMPQYSGCLMQISGCNSTFRVSQGLIPATIRKNVFETKPGTTSALSKSIRRQVEECGNDSNAFKCISSMTNLFWQKPKFQEPKFQEPKFRESKTAAIHGL